MASNGTRKLFSVERRQLASADGPTASASLDIGAVSGRLTEIEDKIDRLAEAVGDHEPSENGSGEVARAEIQEIRRKMLSLQLEVAALRHLRGQDEALSVAALELAEIVQTTERSANEILDSTEQIDRAVADLRGMIVDEDAEVLCDKIESLTAKIFEAANFQDLTGQRVNKVLRTIHEVEEHLDRMIEIWGRDHFATLPIPKRKGPITDDGNPLCGPALNGDGLSQADIDALFD